MKIALISDIHGNLEALEAVLEDIWKNNIKTIYCLGSIIGKGVNSAECLDLVFKHCEVVLLGRTEEILSYIKNGKWGGPINHIHWAYKQLKPRWLSSSCVRKRWKMLETLPLSYVKNHYLFVHGSPRDPTYDHHPTLGTAEELLLEMFSLTDKVCFKGCAYDPFIITKSLDNKIGRYSPQNQNTWIYKDFLDSVKYELQDNGVWKYRNDEKIICCIGSVGRVTNTKPLTCYVIISDEEITYRWISYNSQAFELIETHKIV